PALLWQVTDAFDVGRIEPFAIKIYFAAVGCGYLIDNSDQRCLACTVWTEQTKDSPLFDTCRDVVQRAVTGVLFYDVIDFQHGCQRLFIDYDTKIDIL